MARRLIAVGTVVLLAVAATPPVSGLPDPRQNDAGYGIDAPDVKEAALPIGSGTYQGNITGLSDQVDAYRLDPPPRSVVRVRLTAEKGWSIPDPPLVVQGTLESRIGAAWVYDSGAYLGDGTWMWNITAGAGERVNLTISMAKSQGFVELMPYTIQVTFDRFDHARLLDGSDRNASAWRIRVPEGVPVRFEGFSSFQGPIGVYEGGMTFSHAAIGAPEGCGWGTSSTAEPDWPVPGAATGRTATDRDSVVWTHGLPRDVHVGAPIDVPDGVYPRPMLFQQAIERTDGNFTVHYGHVANASLGPLGWVLWDGPVVPKIERVHARARFATLEDFDDGGGRAVQAGPYVAADNVSLTWTVPDKDRQMVHLLVDGTTPRQAYIPAASRDARFRVELPDGSTRALMDDWQVWATGGDTYVPAGHAVEAQAGTWRVTAEHVDGAEGDRIRSHLIEFGFDPGCPDDTEAAEPSGSTGGADRSGSSGPASDCGVLCGVSAALEGGLTQVLELLR